MPSDGKTFRIAAVLAVIVLAFMAASALRGRAPAEDQAAKNSQAGRAGEQALAAPSVAATPAAAAPQPEVALSASSAPSEVPPLSEPIDPLNPKRGPGAVLNFDAATAPLLPEGGTAVDYVTQYYANLKERDYEAASAMVPKESGAQTVTDFLALLAGYEPQGYYITDVTDSAGGQIVTAIQFGADNRSWNTVWEFVDTARGRVLKDVKYALPQGGACH